MSLDYKHKYLKYKNKYIYLQKQIRGGGDNDPKSTTKKPTIQTPQLLDSHNPKYNDQQQYIKEFRDSFNAYNNYVNNNLRKYVSQYKSNINKFIGEINIYNDLILHEPDSVEMFTELYKTFIIDKQIKKLMKDKLYYTILKNNVTLIILTNEKKELDRLYTNIETSLNNLLSFLRTLNISI
jgi:hypothetical protein